MGGVRIQSGASIPNLINLCVDRSVEGEISGRIYHCYTEEPWRFENVVQLLRYLERFYDGIRFPEASVMLRNFAGKERQAEPPEISARRMPQYVEQRERDPREPHHIGDDGPLHKWDIGIQCTFNDDSGPYVFLQRRKHRKIKHHIYRPE